ncbi:fibrinogen-like protein 1 [Clavelina lepadiformis]|uniref:fibrinogen-like protein 1 n=1 Tax=Clavelina lepadiformis TaxID=159417 RepID=UPI004042CF69
MSLLKGMSLKQNWFYYCLLLLPFYLWHCQAVESQAGNILKKVRKISDRLGNQYLFNKDFHHLQNCQNQQQVQKKFAEFTKNQFKFGYLHNELHKECTSIYASGSTSSGIYPIWLKERFQFTYVYCDMELVSTKKGWTTIQRRMNGKINFERGWDDYFRGFGNPRGEHWLGLENMYRLSKQNSTVNQIRRTVVQTPAIGFDLEDWDGVKAFVQYGIFNLKSKTQHYLLDVFSIDDTYKENFSVSPVTGYKFSTPDRDNDNNKHQHCARNEKSGWWFSYCKEANLNGAYPKFKQEMSSGLILWRGWINLNPNNTALRFVSIALHHGKAELRTMH